MSSYVKTPTSISFSSIIEKDYSLSSSQFVELVMPNQNFVLVSDFLDRKLQRKDLGFEVGSLNYIGQSTHYFLRTKALQQHSFLPEITSETALPIMPNSFVKMNLKKDDLIISKDSNIGEIVILDKDYPNFMLSGALYKLPVTKNKYYLLAFIKHNIFREQLDALVPKGATIRHAKTLFLDCKIPMPNYNAENTIKFIELLTQAIINKEQLIKQRHETILQRIETELLNNQKPNKFKFELPTINEIENVGRLDTGLYSEVFKQITFLIKNYKDGYLNVYDLGFTLSRGQNLQESNIGKSVYSDKHYKNFYSLALPTNFSDYGTIDKIIYLGNSDNLKTLKQGEVIFGAEGTFRSIVVCDEKNKHITNIHGITLYNQNLVLSVFVKCYMDFLTNKGVIDCVKVGGHGGSFAQKYWDIIPFPKFANTKQKEIALLYHNSNCNYNANTFTLDSFLEQDNTFNEIAGIYELDKTAKQLKEILSQAIDDIANDREVEINFTIQNEKE
jgi:type I restriction enzyme S subunit